MNEETKKTIGEAADKFAFQVPYNGTSDFYNNDRHEGFIAGATWAITTFNADEQLAEPGQPVPAGEWISVEEELPEKNLPVLIAEPPCSENEPWNINVSFWDGSYSKSGMVKHAQFPDEQDEQPGYYWPTHWRPLPAPPSPKQEDNQ